MRRALSIAVLAGSSIASAQSPSVMDTNAALRMAVRCTTRTAPEPAPECLALVEASRSRVAFPTLGDSGHPRSWTSELTLLRADGTLLKVGSDTDRSFHGMVWVEAAGLYVGYASWYGEDGAVMVFHPAADGLVRMPGVPVLSPDGQHMVSADSSYGLDQVDMALFSMGATGPELLQRYTIDLDMAEVVDVAFAGRDVVIGAANDEGLRIRRIDISAHRAATAPGLLDVETCTRSDNARYLTGDQVFLRREPGQAGAIEAALPWGTCVRTLGTFQGWALVEVADQQGFVSGRLLSATPPARTPLPRELVQFSFCTDASVVDAEGHGIEDLLLANQRAGVPGYYIRPHLDDYCLSLRPAEDATIDLGRFERSDATALSVRLATWTLALAPESAYRAYSSAALLNESPLFRPVHQPRSAAGAGERPPLTASDDEAMFGARRAAVQPPPESVYLIPFSPDEDGLRFHGAQTFDGLGVGQSGFPAGRWRLSEDRSAVVLDRALPAVVFDPCAGEFLPVSLEVSYIPATGRLGARIDEPTRARLEACSASIPLEQYGAVQFPAVVDETPGSALLALLTTPADARRVLRLDNPVGLEHWGREWAWHRGSTHATLRTRTLLECGAVSETSLEVHDGGLSYRLWSSLWDTWDCGL